MRLGPGVAGELKDEGNTTGSITLNSDEFTEIEFAVLATANALNGNYCFRLVNASGPTALDSYSVWAEVSLVPTAVALVSFEALGVDGAVELRWETGSELDNLGFHLYRSLTEEGPYEQITSNVIPGLGSSPEGAKYAYRDSGLTNGVTYYYQLEDIETTGVTELHGPVSAMPTTEVAPGGGADDEEGGGSTGEDLGDETSQDHVWRPVGERAEGAPRSSVARARAHHGRLLRHPTGRRLGTARDPGLRRLRWPGLAGRAGVPDLARRRGRPESDTGVGERQPSGRVMRACARARRSWWWWLRETGQCRRAAVLGSPDVRDTSTTRRSGRS